MTKHLHWGTGIAIVYAVFASATVGFAVFAMSQDVDLVSPDYYAAAMTYDSRQAATERAINLAVEATIEWQDSKGAAALVIAFPNTVRPASGTVALYRASDPHADRSIPIDSKNIDDGGKIRLPLSGLAAGPWIVQISWTSSGQAYYVERRMVVR